jgi:broad specificity phosphatase PhoE
MRRLLLVRHAPTAATRRSAFPSDEPLDDRGREQASTLSAALPRHAAVVTSPALRCRQTAEAAGLTATTDPGLAECDFGRWRGATLAELNAGEPEGVGAWMSDADAAPHGGESLTAFVARIGGWLERQAAEDGGLVAITHGGVIKAAVVAALGAPLTAFWRVDAAPLAITELHAHGGRWTVSRTNMPVTARAGVAADAGALNAGIGL